ncbi:MAG TPA: DUF1015 family protein [Hyphomicrobiaceae bacterium]|nr:DUF1015 family protein [Hyphomicrobiaceae bacterium]
MTLIKPFRALRPVPARARDVLAPPYDVLTSGEARERARGRPWSFLHVSKAEIDLPEGTDPHSDSVYLKAAESLEQMIAERVLQRDARPHLYAYRTVWRGQRQTGLACIAAVAGYENGRVRKHELTAPTRENDRVRLIEALNAETGPVMLAYPHAPEIDTLLGRATARDPDVAVTADDDVTHELWVIADAGPIEELTHAFEALPAVYIADGHTRAAAAARVAAARGGDDPEASHRYFLAVIFPHHSMAILDYNRVVRDLAGRTPETLVRDLGERYAVSPSASPVRPTGPREVGMYLNGGWYALRLKRELVPDDAVGRLPCSLLADNLLKPLLDIADERSDERIDCVGGARGLGELTRRVDSGEMAVAFALYPMQMDDVMAVADAGAFLPPRSTWFEPKLADGMVSHVLD